MRDGSGCFGAPAHGARIRAPACADDSVRSTLSFPAEGEGFHLRTRRLARSCPMVRLTAAHTSTSRDAFTSNIQRREAFQCLHCGAARALARRSSACMLEYSMCDQLAIAPSASTTSRRFDSTPCLFVASTSWLVRITVGSPLFSVRSGSSLLPFVPHGLGSPITLKPCVHMDTFSRRIPCLSPLRTFTPTMPM